MSSETPSGTTQPPTGTENGSKRARCVHFDSSVEPSSETTSTPTETPLAAAKKSGKQYLETLHNRTAEFVGDLMHRVLAVYATSHYKDIKTFQIQRDPNWIPSSCKFEVPLQPINEVRESEGFTTLEGSLRAAIDGMQLQLAGFVKRAYALNNLGLRDRLRYELCSFLHKVARVFIAEQDLSEHTEYSPHQAVIDLLVGHPDTVTNCLPKTGVRCFLKRYVEFHGLSYIPRPSWPKDDKKGVVVPLINEMNGPSAPRLDKRLGLQLGPT